MYQEENQVSVHTYGLPLGSSHPSRVTIGHRAELPMLYNRFPLAVAIYLTHRSVLTYWEGAPLKVM